MEYTVLKCVPIKDAVKDHELILRSFVAENDFVYFQTIIKICDTNGIILETQPLYSWRTAKKDFNEILKNIGKFLELAPHEVYQLNRKNKI
jgi:hypothetical protein